MMVIAVWHVEWQSGVIHEGVFLHLSAFTSVVCLQLADVKFPNLLVFGRIIYALPNLEEFSYNQLSFTNKTFNASSIIPRPTKIKELSSLSGESYQSAVIDFFVSMKDLAASLETIHFAFWEPPISIKDNAVLRIGPLLRAAGTSLRDLSLSFHGIDLDAAEASGLIGKDQYSNSIHLGLV